MVNSVLTIRDALDIYQSFAPDLKSSTFRRMRHEVNRWERLTAVQTLDQVSLAAFSDFRNVARTSGLSPNSIESNVSTVRLLISTAKDLQYYAADAPPVGRRLRKNRPTPQPVTADELDAITSVIGIPQWPEVERPDLWWRSWMAMGIWTGLRLADLTWGLRLEHMEESKILYAASKTSKTHPFPRPAFIAGHTYHLEYPAGRSPKQLRRQLAEFCEEAGVRRLTPKNFRQGSITMWACASEQAGKIIHGCGMPTVMNNYLPYLAILEDAVPRVKWPACLNASGQTRQLTLF